MSIIIQAKKAVTPAELVAFLTERKDCFKYLMVSDWREIDFVTFDPTHHRIPQSDRGRAFGEHAELRWRRSEDDNDFVCRWLSDDVKLPCDDWGKPLDEKWEVKEASYLLWGEPLWEYDAEDKPQKWQRDPKENRIWYQARIPKKLKYPIDTDLAKQWNATDKTPLVLKVCEYKKNGQTMFERFVGLERYNPKKED